MTSHERQAVREALGEVFAHYLVASSFPFVTACGRPVPASRDVTRGDAACAACLAERDLRGESEFLKVRGVF